MGLFDNIGDAEAAIGRRYDTAGTYIEFIERIGEKTTRASGEAVFLEKKVILVMDPKDAEQPHYSGEGITHMMTSNNQDYFLKNVKTFIIEIASQLVPDFDSDRLTNEQWAGLAKNVMGEKQPFAGNFFIVDKTTFIGKSGKPWTRVNYKQHLSPAQVKEMVLAEEDGAKIVARLWPNGEIDKMVESETA